MKFNIRINDLEVRSCNKRLSSKDEHTTAEIVKWSKDKEDPHCWTIAYWSKCKDYYYLEFIGNRPFDDVQPNLFMKLAKKGQKILDEFNIESEDEIEYLYDYEE